MQISNVSVVIPTCRTSSNIPRNLDSIARSLQTYNTSSQMVIMADRTIERNDFLRKLAHQYPFIRLFESPMKLGSAYARLKALQEASHDVILFTDDDCIVPLNWVSRMHYEVQHYGVVTGNLAPLHTQNVFSQVDAHIDQLRMQSLDKDGNAKYLSFPNCGIRRDLLPRKPFTPNSNNTTEDIELGCRLRLQGIKIHFDPSISVGTEYPMSLVALLKRKIKHAKGIAFLRAQLGKEKCAQIGLAESPGEMLIRWIGISLRSQMHPIKKMYLVLANSVYCSSLAYYDREFRNSNIEKDSI